MDLIEIPSRKKLRQKNLFNVTKCSMVWQVPNGDYLGVKVTRHTKSKKTFYNNIELFRLNEPGVPVEMLDMKDAVMSLTFEPNGSRFAMIHAENPDSTKVNVSFYNMRKKVENSVLKAKAGGGGKKKGGGGAGGCGCAGGGTTFHGARVSSSSTFSSPRTYAARTATS